MKKNGNFTVKGSVIDINYHAPTGWQQLYFLMSDVHFDSFFCHREALIKHLNRVKEKNAQLIIVGDWFDAMQGRFDKRRSLNELRPEYRRDDYYDRVKRSSFR